MRSTFTVPSSWSWSAARLPLAGLALLALGACASPKPPTTEMALGQASVERATSSAPESAMEIARARDKMARAKVALANEDFATARRLAQEADADARLAEAKAKVTRTEKELAAAREATRQMRGEGAARP